MAKRKTHAVSQDRAWKQVKADWRDVVLVCRKCSKKLGGGFGPDGDEALGKVLRKTLAESAAALGKIKTRRRQVAVLDVGCLDICPKKAVVMVKCSDPKSMILVPEGAATAVVLDRLALQIGHTSEPLDAEAAE